MKMQIETRIVQDGAPDHVSVSHYDNCGGWGSMAAYKRAHVGRASFHLGFAMVDDLPDGVRLTERETTINGERFRRVQTIRFVN
jgi:hypothetical protein